ncbi:MAG: beta-Ala-His dipeptidase [Selenomonadaceae bacterium]|nr:beta-Ala-His dipeptidase [Selenomonadaceae bacterium]
MLEKVLDEFKKLAAIPRPSKHEEKVSNFLRDYLKSYGFEVVQDAVKNIIAEIPASVGKENVPRTILQAHMDMVCVAEENYKFNPLEDSIKLIRTEDFLTAEGTSLGADDGMGIAEILYIAKNHEKFLHGPIRIIFTVDEEQGMTGAINLDKKYLADAKFFINCDSEIFEEIVAGSAGNIHVDFSRRINYTAPKFSNAFKVKFSGLHGGHSGIEISKDYANCIKLAAKFLSQGNFQLAKFSGGSAPNVIPSDSEFVVVTDFSTDEVATRADSLKSRVKKIYDEDLKIEIVPVDLPEKVFSDSDFEKFVALILNVHSGVYSLNGTLVKTSANIGIVRTADAVEINILARSNVSELLENFTDTFAQVAKLANFEVKFGTPAPAWNFNSDSKLLKIMAEIFESQNKFAPKIATSHGGLECSFFAVKNPALDIVSIGTTNEFIHSTKERLHLKTVAPHVNLIISTLEKIAE